IAFAQSFPDLKFTRLSEKDGLSSNSVTSVAQDRNGIIWAGTENGLNRFDGYGFAKFYADPYDTTTINANGIESISSDQKDNLWIMTTAGICRFNITTQKATAFKTGGNTLATFRIYDGSNIWFENGQPNPYIVSPLGLYHFTDNKHYQALSTGFPSFSYKGFYISSYSKIVQDKNGQLWAFRQNKIYKINNATKKVETEYASPNAGIGIYDVIFDSYNRCWVSTWADGLYRFSPEQNLWSQMPLKIPVNTLIKYGVEWEWNGRKFLVFSVATPGLLFIDEKTLATHVYQIIGPTGDIKAPFVDRQNILWVPTSDGLYYYSPSNKLFDIIPITDGQAKGKPDAAGLSVVYNMQEEKNGYWISRRYNGGILKYDNQWKLEKYWPDVAGGLGAAIDDRLATTREGYDFKQMDNLVFVTTEWGMLTINLSTWERKIYQCPWTKSIMRLRTIVPENEQKWWVRSYNQGVFVFNPKTFQFTRHYNIGRSFIGGKPPEANYLLRDKKGRIFETTNAGLFQYNNETDTFLLVKPKGKLIFGTSLMGMAEDNDGLLWIGSDNGIIAFNPDSGKVVKSFTENNRIGQVQRICVDSDQNVWFNSITGYWCWLRNRDKIIQFKYSLGLPYNDDGMFYTTSDGNVYAGGVVALVQFYPKRLMNYTISSSAKIVEAFVNDKFLSFGRTVSGEKELILDPQQNNLQVHFDVINYDQLENNLFFYKLQPGQKEWKQIENGNLSFNNLAPGDYKLTVRGGNKLTGGFTNTDVLVLSIKPHWFQSWWFALLCIITACAVVFYIVIRRIRYIRKQAGFKQKIAETEMMALRSQMNPHFIFNSLNGIEYFILQNEKRNASVYLNKFASLIRIILSNSRKDVVPFVEDMQTIRLYIDLELLRFNHNFGYVTDIDQPLLDSDYTVPPLLIQPFVENAIIHGFAYSDRKDLQLKISAILRGEYIIYTIEDNGVGRRRSSDYNALNKPNHTSLGLQITQQRISIFNEQHQANSMLNIEDLYDENQQPCGTRVTVKIKTI
ncbi:MAG TPA: histidine kinase, partial [Hanamia sp.]|nr:histidine kinase [Hanamia sp.]